MLPGIVSMPALVVMLSWDEGMIDACGSLE